ncbi:MAG: ubiquinol-cytochrome c reductase iron-sulfur subunit [Candidimonas sp.]|nr:MAG: ubiquinol-cytochrome c reductase iron-sulfur subunit [Candidimonas sp.]TAM22767.1 MAG: ubiquinol-cytochrome c reductase iron-sulfur subunit [Candidimonas sp.]TAM74529.1 MAG: ubiquinol-cytochrome c reductase iron-sulfur subunit [Candidimonas sp.]
MNEELNPPLEHPELALNSRRVLLAATATMGAVGVVAAAVPFVESMNPSARAEAAAGPVEVNVSQLAPGQLMVAAWRGRPIWVLHRSKEELAALAKMEPLLADPHSLSSQQPSDMKNLHLQEGWRSIKPEYLVLVGICTHLGCIPSYMPEPGSVDSTWPGGFLCPCHGSRYDLSGRVLSNFPAPLNLPVPPYFFESDTLIKVGMLKDKEDQSWEPNTW